MKNAVRLFDIICLQNFPYHTQNNISHKYLSTLINLLICCIYDVLHFAQHTASPGSFGFAIAALALITFDLKKGKK